LLCPDPRAAGARAGLALSSTSQKLILFDPVAARNSRMRRGVVGAAKLVESGLQDAGARYRAAMLLLTYDPRNSWSHLHIAVFFDHLRKYCRRHHGWVLPYVWKFECGAGGNLHYHVLLWLPRGVTLPKPDKQGWWPHGFTSIRWARNPVGYIAKYCGKDQLGQFPLGARLWGSGGLNAVQRALLVWRLAPRWLRDRVPEGSRLVRRAGGWWDNTTSRIRYRSPWMLSSVFGGLGFNVVWRGWSVDDVSFY